MLYKIYISGSYTGHQDQQGPDSARPAVHPAGLPEGVRFHDSRHTYAGFLIAEGTRPKAIMERMGHRSITVALDRYGHLLPSMEEHLTEALNRLGRAVAQRVSAAGATIAYGGVGPLRSPTKK